MSRERRGEIVGKMERGRVGITVEDGMLSSGEMKFHLLMYLYASTSATPSILGEREQPHWLWMMDHILCIHRACTTCHVHSKFSAMTVMTSIATAVVLPAALTIANSSGYWTKKSMAVNVWVSQWQPTLLGDALSLKDGLPHCTTLGSTSIISCKCGTLRALAVNSKSRGHVQFTYTRICACVDYEILNIVVKKSME